MFRRTGIAFSIMAAVLFLSTGRVFCQNKIGLSIDKLGQTLFYIDKLYLDTANIDNLTDKALISIMKELDPHSSYITAKDMKSTNESLSGNFEGIGIEFALINDTLTINSTIPDGPSEKAGIRAGDKIVKVDGVEISGPGLNIEKVHGYLKGPKGSKVNLHIKRRGVAEDLQYLITRDKIPLNSLDSYYTIGKDIFYMRLTRFSATSFREMIMALADLQKYPSGIILDFRGNPGGYLVAAIQIANLFLEKGELIVYTEGRAVRRSDEYANGEGLLKNVPLAILIDDGSASASEIVAGAVQDWDRGVIIGRRSFGKGLVQQQIPLKDGSAIRLTVSRYHTPSGRVIQSPYEEGKQDEYYKKLVERYNRGETFSKDSIHMPDSLKFYTLKKRRVVYGGGGIMPDIFVPQDTSYYSKTYTKILTKGLLTDYVNDYADKHRDEIKSKYPDYKDFIKKYKVNEAQMDDFLSYCRNNGVEPVAEDLQISGNEIRRYIKGLMIRYVYSFNNFIEFINQEDKEVLKAVEELQKRG